MSEANSPSFALGQRDGEADAALIGLCPPQQPRGPQPPNPAYPVMYNRGYAQAFALGTPHVCTEQCRKEAAGESARGGGEAAMLLTLYLAEVLTGSLLLAHLKHCAWCPALPCDKGLELAAAVRDGASREHP